MSIQYSVVGSCLNFTFTPSTRSHIVENLKTQLVASGWTVASGATGDWTLDCAATPQSLRHRVRLYDPGSGTCAQVIASDIAGSYVATSKIFLRPTSTQWRIISQPHNFYITEDSTAYQNRTFGFSSTLYIPSWLSVPTEAIVAGGQCLDDTNNTYFKCWKTHLFHDQTGGGSQGYCGNYTTIYNSTMYNSTYLDTNIGTLRFKIGGTSKYATTDMNNMVCSKFMDGTVFMYTPYLCWGPAGIGDAARVGGVVFDAVLVEDAFSYGTIKVFDSKNWFAITHNNVASSVITANIGTLFVRIP